MMKKNGKLISLACVLLGAVLVFGGCETTGGKTTPNGTAQGNTTNVAAESFAYIHEPEKEILRLAEDGTAIFNGEAYTYVREGDWLTLKDSKGQETKMRFTKPREDKEKWMLYERTEYHFAGEGEPDGVIGFWQGGPEDRLAYEFTTKGTYLEDGTFPGYYEVDEENKMIKLMYNDHFEDTYIYYELDGNKLYIDYPWPVVRTEEGETK